MKNPEDHSKTNILPYFLVFICCLLLAFYRFIENDIILTIYFTWLSGCFFAETILNKAINSLKKSERNQRALWRSILDNEIKIWEYFNNKTPDLEYERRIQYLKKLSKTLEN